MKRTFFAIEMPKTFIEFYRQSVYPGLCRIKGLKTVLPENCHITLKFLGPTGDNLISDIARSASAAALSEAPFETACTGFGAFPGMKGARVLWLGFDDAEGRLRRLSALVDSAAKPFGFSPEERPFQPHLTVARVKEPVQARILGDIRKSAESNLPVENIKIDVITFFESVLTPQGPIYTALARIPLTGTGRSAGS
jgi:RNA 2',3'-cyclic 3'-phosphodiesterase